MVNENKNVSQNKPVAIYSRRVVWDGRSGRIVIPAPLLDLLFAKYNTVYDLECVWYIEDLENIRVKFQKRLDAHLKKIEGDKNGQIGNGKNTKVC